MSSSSPHSSSSSLPQILVLGPPIFLPYIKSHLSTKYNLHLLTLPSALSHTHPNIRALIASAATPVAAPLLDKLPSLGIVHTTSAGIDKVDLEECPKRGVKVASAGSVFSEDVADLAVGLFADVLRKVTACDRFVRNNGNALSFQLGSRLGGKRVGIVGLGSIGLEVAKRLEAFGCTILYSSRKEKPSVSYHFYKDIYELATESDALIICCALNDQTYHMINRDVMLALGKQGVIVNVGRGQIIDQKELVQCLLQGEIGGAGLDVLENEPNVPQELLALDNVVMTPHCGICTPESVMALCKLIESNLDAFFSNKPLLSEVQSI